MDRGWPLKSLVFCCFLLLAQNILHSIHPNETPLSAVPDFATILLLRTTTTTTTSPIKREYLLSVPFYVYEDLAWVGATIGGKKVEKFADPPPNNNNNNNKHGKFKHGGDYWMMQASLKDHPMRTKNMTEAKLFFVPWLLNFFDYKIWKQRKLCWKGKCDIALLLDSLSRLEKSPAYQKHPDHHIIVRSFYSGNYDKWNRILLNKNPEFQKFLDAYKKMQTLIFEDQNSYRSKKGRYAFTSYHVGSPCPIYDGNHNEKPYDVAMIAQLHDQKPKFKNRRKICKWLGMINDENNNAAKQIRVSVCGQGEQCPALAESKFGFHVAGDTYASQRLMDTMLSGTVPIFTHLHQFELAGHWIDWSQLGHYLPVHDDWASMKNNGRTHTVTRHSLLPPANRTIFEHRLRAILEDKEGYQRKHQKVLEHIPLFNYSTMYPFDTYMYLFQAELFPETRHPPGSSKWSAMILPPPLFDSPPGFV